MGCESRSGGRSGMGGKSVQVPVRWMDAKWATIWIMWMFMPVNCRFKERKEACNRVQVHDRTSQVVVNLTTMRRIHGDHKRNNANTN